MRSLAILVLAYTAHAATPTFFLDAPPTDRAVFPVIEKYLQPSDFISARDLAADLALRRIIDPSHQFELAKTLRLVQSEAAQPCTKTSPQTIWYHTLAGAPETPSIATALHTIHAANCHQAGIIPSAQFWGYSRVCEYNLAVSPYQQIDWTLVDRVIIQGEGFLNPACRTGIADYQKFLASIVAFVRARNPKIAVYAHASLRFTPPPLIIHGIQALSDQVDGFLLSYPRYGEHVYCTAENLEAVLKAFRPVAP
ncbi:MAG: hypothetical protein JWP63_6647 [Candidatus Solibacter sp.]|nr:hypothetical protein [Candidatus Solibacter sp.]